MTESNLRAYTLASIQPESKGCFFLRLSVEHCDISYQSAGQYVQLAAPSVVPSFFAIANAPHHQANRLEFLIKASGPAASAITATQPSGTLLLSNAQGSGFALEKTRSRDLLLLTMGTGISALRPVLQSIMDSRREYGRVILLHGARTEHEMPFFKEHELWRASQIDVRPVFSQQSGLRQGRILAFIAEALSPNTMVLLAGSKEMIGLTRLELARHQLGPNQILTNY
jgi:NAD(P)H-flavin reductase